MNHQQRTQNALQTIAMIEGLNATPAQKNELINLVGANYHVASIVAANDQYSARGLRSPLAQIGATLNSNFAQDVPPTPETFPPTPIGRQFAMNVYPLSKFISLDQDMIVATLVKDEARRLCPGLTIDDLDNMIITITARTGFACCSIANCPGVTNLQGVVFTHKVHHRVAGVTVVCRGHYQGTQRALTLTKGSSIYVFVDNIQQLLLV